MQLTGPAPPGAWICPNCKVAVASEFCAGCGERQVQRRDLTLVGLADQLVRIFTRVDGRLLRSFGCLIWRPGILTTAFLNGQRKPFIGPFQIFLVANLMFFALQSFSNMKIFSNTLAFRLDGQLWSEYGVELVTQYLRASGQTFAQYAPVFDNAVALNAKSLIGLMVPVLALFPPLVFWRTSRPLALHVVFALHFYAYVLVLFCVPMAAVVIDAAFGGTGVMDQGTDDIVSIALLFLLSVYLFRSIGPVYGARGALRIFQTLLMTAAAVWIFLIYRFMLLPITLFTTRG